MTNTRRLKFEILIVCRNRKDLTLSAISKVFQQSSVADLSISLLDDASDDGTAEGVSLLYPQVDIVRGDGTAFWNGGLFQLWSTMRDKDVDAFVWLNDDTILDEDAFTRIVDGWNVMTMEQTSSRFILVGSTIGGDGNLSYGGYNVERSPFALRLIRVEPNAIGLLPVSTFNGNIVVVGRDVLDCIGINDPHYFHNLGDVDYGLRAERAGIPVMLLSRTLGRCNRNTAKSELGYGSANLSVFEQWQRVRTHHGLPFSSWWRFTRRHSGRYWLLHFLVPYRHLLQFWKISGHRRKMVRGDNDPRRDLAA